VEEVEEKISEKMDSDEMLNFFSFLAKENDILKMLGREETWLAIPKIYLENVLTLYKNFMMLNMKSAEEFMLKSKST